jgi:hypothetical protein
MNARNRKFLMAAILVAASATTLGARAEDPSAFYNVTAKDTAISQTPEADAAQSAWFMHELAKGTVDTYDLHGNTGTSVAPTQASAKESPAFENFENQLSAGTVATYTPSEHTGNAN